MSEYKVNEIFTSINGEGLRSGTLATFIRLTSCNLNCSYCDTRYACETDAAYTLMSEQEILDQVLKSGAKNITLTGGEPLLARDIDRLLLVLTDKKYGLSVEIETNGSIPISKYDDWDLNTNSRPLFTLDYKTPGSGMENFMLTENYDHLHPGDSVKFVCTDISDMERSLDIINKYHLNDEQIHPGVSCFFSPVSGSIDPAEMVGFMKEKKINNVRLQLQMHKIIWSPDRRGV
ncbi:MAG: putative 7-carboxy-7-deazaguanine synthase QueE [Lachnospiraceae bacterium]|jgi:7-carboxy-7-deazaguanine synthase|nr:putative 7-carboxy-7-deazaguanine synthase QueE [Lachnospiraceae bacterium]MEE3461987.1 putative 7-carboxy-7-deazaguanine synthase QueE [Lachnospiraceae bacterium]